MALLSAGADEGAARVEPSGSTTATPSTTEPETTTTTTWTTTTVRIEGLPPLPARDPDGVPGADPTDVCLTAEEYTFLTGRELVVPARVDHPNIARVNGVVFDTSTCIYQNVGGISRTPDPDGAILRALRASAGTTVVSSALIVGRRYVTLFGEDRPSGQSVTLVFSHDDSTYLVGVTDGPDAACAVQCGARVAEAVIARAG